MEESEVSKRLKTLIEALTHSGSNSLNEEIFKEVKKICKSSQSNIPYVYNLVLRQLKKNNSQIRLSAFQICIELFKRSGLFRENVLRDLQNIFDLTTEINSKKLPPPKSAAESLQNLSISTLKSWVDEYGETHKKLKVAYNYLKKCKQVDFETLEHRGSALSIRENEEQNRLRAVNEEKVKKILEEFQSNQSEIEGTITSLSNCLDLLLPPAEEFFIPENDLPDTQENPISVKSENSIYSEDSTQEEEEKEDYLISCRNGLRECGISSSYNLSLEINLGDKFKIIKTEENSSIIENAKDSVRLIINRYLPMVKKWSKLFCKYSQRGNNEIKNIIGLKEKLENILKKYNSLKIDNVPQMENNSESSDDEFEEVKKEGYEDSVDEKLMLDCLKSENSNLSTSSTIKSSFQAKSSQESDINKPSCSKVQSKPPEDADRKTRLLAVAPKVPYDIDLYHWEDENLSTPTLISTKMDVDKFWGCAASDDIHVIPDPNGVSSLRTRVIEFTGKFEPVKWSCRAPLPNGKLCPRKDRYKCPFHGIVIPRDEMGNPVIKEKQPTKVTQNSNTFQDQEFLRDIQAATGIDLTIPQKRKGKRRKPENKNLTHKKMKTSTAALKVMENKNLPGLVDVVKKQNNAYTRLSKKIFNKSSLRRVSAVLNKLDKTKYGDKFGDQFNYI